MAKAEKTPAVPPPPPAEVIEPAGSFADLIGVPPAAPPSAPAADAAELAKLRAELAAKDKALAEVRESAAARVAEVERIARRQADHIGRLEAKSAGPEPINADGPKRKFLVQFPAGTGCPSWVVEAAHPALAFEAYMAAVGMTSTPHKPAVTPQPDDAELGDPTRPKPKE